MVVIVGGQSVQGGALNRDYSRTYPYPYPHPYSYSFNEDENDDGFSLMEVIVVVLIISILAAIVIPVFLNTQDNARQAAVEATASNALSVSQQEVLDGNTDLWPVFEQFETDDIRLEVPESSDIVSGDPDTVCVRATWLGQDNTADAGFGCFAEGEGGTGGDDEEEEEQDISDSLISTWRVEEGDTITLPVDFSGEIEVDWGNDMVGTYTDNRPESPELSFGDHEITITPDLSTDSVIEHFGSSSSGVAPDMEKLLSLDQWAVGDAIDMESAAFIFRGARQLIYSDEPPRTVTDMSRMFWNASNFNQDISHWDVSNVTNMRSMFNYASRFNNGGRPLEWNDTSNVTSMSLMFRNAHTFNQSVASFDMSNVQTADEMFYNAYIFNQNVSGWNVGNVTNMQSMFSGARRFNQDLRRWDVDNVTVYVGFDVNSSLISSHRPRFN